jgi:hypothetical protein
MGKNEKFWFGFALQFLIQALTELFKQLTGDDDNDGK